MATTAFLNALEVLGIDASELDAFAPTESAVGVHEMPEEALTMETTKTDSLAAMVRLIDASELDASAATESAIGGVKTDWTQVDNPTLAAMVRLSVTGAAEVAKARLRKTHAIKTKNQKRLRAALADAGFDLEDLDAPAPAAPVVPKVLPAVADAEILSWHTAQRKAAWDYRNAQLAAGETVTYANACAHFGTLPKKEQAAFTTGELRELVEEYNRKSA